MPHQPWPCSAACTLGRSCASARTATSKPTTCELGPGSRGRFQLCAYLVPYGGSIGSDGWSWTPPNPSMPPPCPGSCAPAACCSCSGRRGCGWRCSWSCPTSCCGEQGRALFPFLCCTSAVIHSPCLRTAYQSAAALSLFNLLLLGCTRRHGASTLLQGASQSCAAVSSLVGAGGRAPPPAALTWPQTWGTRRCRQALRPVCLCCE